MSGGVQTCTVRHDYCSMLLFHWNSMPLTLTWVNGCRILVGKLLIQDSEKCEFHAILFDSIVIDAMLWVVDATRPSQVSKLNIACYIVTLKISEHKFNFISNGKTSFDVIIALENYISDILNRVNTTNYI